MKSLWAMCIGAVVAAGATLPAAAGSGYGAPHAVPGMRGVPGVDLYVENPDAQPPIYWSQGTAPPPPQPTADYGGGFIQYMLTGTERRPAMPHPLPRPLPRQGSLGMGVGPVAYAAPTGAMPVGAMPVAYAEPDAVAAPVQAAIDPMYRRQEVAFAGRQAPGTIVIDTASKFLFLVEGGGRALRYGIGVGRPGFLWVGEKTITRKAEWPDWTPPSEMLARRPDLPRHMEGGIANPLGARAMYLGSSLYRIHGTNEPNTIGTNVSSGCIRLLNEDVADLYARVRVGTRVIVL